MNKRLRLGSALILSFINSSISYEKQLSEREKMFFGGSMKIINSLVNSNIPICLKPASW